MSADPQEPHEEPSPELPRQSVRPREPGNARGDGNQHEKARPPASPASTRDFARLAQRLSAWTSKCALSALILVVGVAFARQVMYFWASDSSGGNSPRSELAPDTGVGEPGRQHLVAFGDQHWAISDRIVHGGRPQVLDALRAECRRTVAAGKTPIDPPRKEEIRFLAFLAKQKPDEQEPGKWRVYQIDGVFPMAVGISDAPASFGSEQDPSRVASQGGRVVTWGLAFPKGPGAWSLFAFQPTGTALTAPSVVDEVVIPPNCQKTVSIRAAGGGVVVAFRGPTQPDAWKHFFDEWFKQRGLKAVGSWEAIGPSWHRQAVSPAGKAAGAVDVQFGPDEREGMAGLILVSGKTAPERPGKKSD